MKCQNSTPTTHIGQSVWSIQRKHHSISLTINYDAMTYNLKVSESPIVQFPKYSELQLIILSQYLNPVKNIGSI